MAARYLIYLMFFASGISGLVYQIVWMRKLSLIFGSSIFATTVVLVCFMAGLALGSYYFGKKAEENKRPLRLYAYLEFGIGIATVVLMFVLLPVMDFSYASIVEAFPPQPDENGVVYASWLINGTRLLLVALLLLGPTTLMGGTLPVMGQHFIRTKSQLGFRVAMLYGLNTIGAMAGCLLTGFYLIRVLGETNTVVIAAAINILVGLGAWLYEKSSPTDAPEPNPPSAQALSPKMRMVLIIFGVAGFTSLAYEVIWFRALYNLIGFHVYTVTVILAAFLFGLSLGSFLVSKLIERIKYLYFTFGVAEILIAGLAIASMPLLENTPAWAQTLMQRLADALAIPNPFILNNLNQFLIAFSIFAVPTVLMGGIFPLVNKIYQTEVQSVGRNVGNVYSINTVGTIIGSAAAGFILLPAFGVSGSIFFIAIINLGLGIILCGYEADKGLRLRGRRFAIASSVLLVALVLGLGLHKKVPQYLLDDNEPFTMPFYTETISSTLAVKEYTRKRNLWGYPDRKLCINNACTAHSSFRDISVHKVLAHTPALMHPNPKQALIVGFGLGSTAYSMLQHRDLQVDCVEILKEEIETAQYFSRENRDIIGNEPRFNLIIEDGRNYISGTEKKYDIVSVNAIAPRFSPALYTEEFFELSRSRMTEEGIMALWLPTYSVSKDAYRSIFKSFTDIFPSSFLFYINHSHYLLVGSAKPINIDLDEFARRAKEPSVKTSLAEVGLEDPITLLSTVIMTPDGFKHWLTGAPRNTDQNPIAEFDMEEQSGMPFNPELMNDSLKFFSNASRYVQGSTIDFSRLEKRSTQMKKWIAGQLDFYVNIRNPGPGMTLMFSALREARGNQFLNALMATYGHTEINRPYFRRFDERFRDVLLEVLGRGPHFVQAHYYLASVLVKINQVETAALHRNKIQVARPDDWLYAFTYGLDLLNMNQPEEAKKTYSKMTKFKQGSEWGHFGLGLMALEAQQAGEAQKQFEAALQINPDFTEAQTKLTGLTQ